MWKGLQICFSYLNILFSAILTIINVVQNVNVIFFLPICNNFHIFFLIQNENFLYVVLQ